MKIIVAGDFHGNFGPVNEMISKKNPSIILQCGDFGWWPRANGKDIGSIRRKIWNQYSLKNKETKIYWCPGNHEDWEELNKISKDKNEILPIYLKLCHYLHLTVLSCHAFHGGRL